VRLAGIVALVSGVVAAGLLGALAGPAPAASAHSLGSGVAASDYVSEVTSVSPATPGLAVRVTELGTRVELTNKGPRDVTVLGYDGEPYLRVGPDGVYENENSPATYLNRDTYAQVTVPAGVQAASPPAWTRLSSGHTVVWHDHRTHWMAPSPPPVAAGDLHHDHVVLASWTIPLRVESSPGVPVTVTGRLLWIARPSPLPWAVLILIAGLASAIAVLVRARVAAWAVFATSVLAAIHGVSLALDRNAVPADRWTVLVAALVCVALSVWALVDKRSRRGGAGVSLPIAALALLFGYGVPMIGTLGHAETAGVLGKALARVSAALALGIGTGVAVASILMIFMAVWRAAGQPVEPASKAQARQ
jgi:hypothetical protein